MNDGKSVLISGGSGLIGRHLTSLLLEKGFTVSHLSRSTGNIPGVKVFYWDPERNIADTSAFTGIDHIIHLAGANIGQGRWTIKRKEEIISSRVNSSRLIHKIITENHIRIKVFISASATGYYGARTSESIFKETDPPAEDFLGTTCRLWEESADMFKYSGIRTVKIRTGVVMEKNDSALSRYLITSRVGLFPVLGSGKQYFPWIHISDLCNIYLKAIEELSMEGAYNAVSPEHTDQKGFVRALAASMKKPFIALPVPSFFLRLAMGSSSVIALKGSRVSCEKLISANYNFLFPDLESALKNTVDR